MVRMTLGRRIASGIVLVLLLMLAVGGVGYVGITGIRSVVGFSDKISNLQVAVASAESHTDRYLLSTFDGDKDLQKNSVAGISSQLSEAARIIAEIKTNSILTSDDFEKLNLASNEITAFGKVFAQYKGLDEEKARLEGASGQFWSAMMENMGKGVLRIENMLLDSNALQAAMINYLKSVTADNWARTVAALDKTNDGIATWAQFVEGSAQLKDLGKEIVRQYGDLRSALEQHQSLSQKQQSLKKAMDGHALKLRAICREFIDLSDKTVQDKTQNSIRLISGFILLALLTGIIYATLSIKGIVRRLTGVIDGVTDGSEQVASAARQVASSGQALAEGASEQAASLEETSSSLEEMSSLTRLNADRAHEAKKLMEEVQHIVDKVNRHMNDMADAVTEITRSSEETGKIIKTIDEIAFQTNLLALNAAVEAARAGEAGAGFAVVADEVRNLAMRAAEASRNTASLIENTIQNIRTGNDLTLSTKNAFNENITITGKVGRLVDEISEASNEQAQGIEQANRAMSQMSAITQRSAAGAEESAGAAEQMSAHAELMKEYVNQLIELIGKGAKATAGRGFLSRWRGGRREMQAPVAEERLLESPRKH